MVHKKKSVVSITELTGLNYERIRSDDEEIHFESFDSIPKKESKSLVVLCFASLGAIYGDISTSPLYTLNVLFTGNESPPTTSDIYGAASAIFYLFTIIVSIKYLMVVIPFGCHKGEGGHLAIKSKISAYLGSGGSEEYPYLRQLVTFLSILGCALVVSDGLLTPSTSILNAMEGIRLPFPDFDHTLPVSIMIIIALMSIQSLGAHRIVFIFAPIIFIWLIALAVIGMINICQHPNILMALNPYFAVKFIYKYGCHGLSSVTLAITGAEALFLDVGYTGQLPVQLSLGLFVYPCLMLNYFGQSAFLVIHNETTIENIFYSSIPVESSSWTYWIVFALATASTIIASQALILGMFAIVHQLIELKYLPKLHVFHFDPQQPHLVYIPLVNKVLTVGLVATCAIFRDSETIAKAYGIGITIDFLITSVLISITVIIVHNLNILLMPLFLFIMMELALIYSNGSKLQNGGWFTISICTIVFCSLLLYKRFKI